MIIEERKFLVNTVFGLHVHQPKTKYGIMMIMEHGKNLLIHIIYLFFFSNGDLSIDFLNLEC